MKTKSERSYTLKELQGLAAQMSDMLKDQNNFFVAQKDVEISHPWLSPSIKAIAANYEFSRPKGGSFATAELRAGPMQVLYLLLPPENIWFEGRPIQWGARIPLTFYFEHKEEDRYCLLRSETPQEAHAARTALKEPVEL